MDYEVSWEERLYFSRRVGRILTDEECEDIKEDIVLLQEDLLDNCEGDEMEEYSQGLREIFMSYRKQDFQIYRHG